MEFQRPGGSGAEPITGEAGGASSRNGRTRLRHLLRVLLAAVISLAISLVLLEAAVQIYTRLFIYHDVEMSRYAVQAKRQSENPKIGHVHRPNVSMRLMGVDVQINSDGFRDRDYDRAHGENHRIIALGDSITFGWGVDESDIFVTLLEKQIGQATQVELINFGTGNYNTEQQVNLFFEKGIAYNPDGVVVFFFINDAEPTPVRSSWLGLTRVRSLTFIWSRVQALRARWGASGTFESYYGALHEPDQPGWQAMTRAFRQLRDVCNERGMTLQVVLLPELHNLIDYPFVQQHARVSEFLEEAGIDHMDLTQGFLGHHNSTELWVALDDAHPNAVAHRMIANQTRAFVEQGIVGR
jgi:hypothetical protein